MAVEKLKILMLAVCFIVGGCGSNDAQSEALGSDDASGEKVWLLDLIAPNRQLATAVLTNFKQIAGDKPIAIHPIVARSVDPEVLEKMRVKGG